MKLKTLFTVAFLGLGTLACGGMGGGANDPLSYMPTATITEPWSGMNLPIGDGKVTMSESNMLTVMYNGNKVDAKLGDYQKSVEGKGFKKEMDVSGDPSTRSVIFDKDGKKLTLTVTTAADITTVSLSKQD